MKNHSHEPEHRSWRLEQRELLNLLEAQLELINQQEQTLELALKQSTA
jgi:hypothetical protein